MVDKGDHTISCANYDGNQVPCMFLLQVEDGAHGVGRGVVLVDLHALADVRQRRHGVAPLDVHLCPHREGRGVLGGDVVECVEDADGLVIPLGVAIAERHVVPDALVLRVELHGCPVVTDGLVEAPEPHACQGPHLIGVGHERIPLDGLRAVGLGAAVVVQIEFRQSAEEVRVAQVGLGVHHLVKILD